MGPGARAWQRWERDQLQRNDEGQAVASSDHGTSCTSTKAIAVHAVSAKSVEDTVSATLPRWDASDASAPKRHPHRIAAEGAKCFDPGGMFARMASTVSDRRAMIH
jgi:hypothetical protein